MKKIFFFCVLWSLNSFAEYVPGEFLVVFKQPKNIRSLSGLRSLDLKVDSSVNEDTFLISSSKINFRSAQLESETQKILTQLKALPEVLIAEPNYIWHANVKPNDLSYGKLWGLKNLTAPGIDINAEMAWNTTTGSSQVIVACIDTGIDYTHPDLKDNMWINKKELNGKKGFDDDGNGFKDDVYGYNFVASSKSFDPKDDDIHGTHTAGTIGAKGNNRLGVVGVNWNVKLMALKFLDADGSGTNEDAIRAIDYARKMGAKIMSNSWGGPDNSLILKAAIERARKAGILFVAAAGNEGQDNDKWASFPANYNLDNIISVASINSLGELSSFSNYGLKKVHVAAPGEGIWSTVPGNKFMSLDGTSMATPHVSGVAALLLSHKPQMSYLQLKESIIKSAKPLKSLQGKMVSGGLVDAAAALQM